MEQTKRFMLGNIVLIDGKYPCEIKEIGKDAVNVKPLVETPYGDEFDVGYDFIGRIPLTDSFFADNEYKISEPIDYVYGIKMQHIVAKDGIGPAVTKYTTDTFCSLMQPGEVEYCITGIIIRTVDDFQNIMNVCGCGGISDKVLIKF